MRQALVRATIGRTLELHREAHVFPPGVQCLPDSSLGGTVHQQSADTVRRRMGQRTETLPQARQGCTSIRARPVGEPFALGIWLAALSPCPRRRRKDDCLPCVQARSDTAARSISSSSGQSNSEPSQSMSLMTPLPTDPPIPNATAPIAAPPTAPSGPARDPSMPP